MKTYKFTIEHLHCASCAAKMEISINKLAEVDKASVIFPTRSLLIEGNLNETSIQSIQTICEKIEPGVMVQSTTIQTYTYTIQNLDCANCASKMQRKLSVLPYIEEATVVFETKRLILKSTVIPNIEELNSICCSIENGVEVVYHTSKKHEPVKEKKELIELIVGSVLFVLSIVLVNAFDVSHHHFSILICSLIAYLILGGKVLLKALSNMSKGQIFDEHFLMAIATLGALLIQEYSEAVGVMLFFRVGSYFEAIAVERSRKQIIDAIDLREEITHLYKDEKIQDVATETIQVSDVIIVKVGERVPVDAIVMEGTSYVDTSAINGEVVPVKVGQGDMIYSGYLNTNATLTLQVEKMMQDSMVSRILDAVENAAANKPKMDHFITRFARIYTPLVVGLALFTALGMPLLTKEPFYPWIYTALSFLVMSCPCALVLSVPLAYYCGIGAASKRRIICKGGSVLESLAKIKLVVMDKTGTISKGEFAVQEVETYAEYTVNEVLSFLKPLEAQSNHPIAQSITQYISEQQVDALDLSQIEECSGRGMKALYRDDLVLCGNERLMKEYNIVVPESSINTVASVVYVAYKQQCIGKVSISDTIKEESKQAIANLHKQGLTTAILSGDRHTSVQYVAQETGIDIVRSNLLPEQKYDELQALSQMYGDCMFVGDGINDAIVLAGANVGAAMASGSDLALEASDVVFMNSNVDAINDSIHIAKKTVQIAKQNVIGAILIKAIVMVLGITGIYANMWLAVFADTGVAFICILNSIRILYQK